MSPCATSIVCVIAHISSYDYKKRLQSTYILLFLACLCVDTADVEAMEAAAAEAELALQKASSEGKGFTEVAQMASAASKVGDIIFVQHGCSYASEMNTGICQWHE